ncbi:MAG TPA: hypothetical protein VIL86_11240 [Tepidisphaeraceae bacterium]
MSQTTYRKIGGASFKMTRQSWRRGQSAHWSTRWTKSSTSIQRIWSNAEIDTVVQACEFHLGFSFKVDFELRFGENFTALLRKIAQLADCAFPAPPAQRLKTTKSPE